MLDHEPAMLTHDEPRVQDWMFDAWVWRYERTAVYMLIYLLDVRVMASV